MTALSEVYSSKPFQKCVHEIRKINHFSHVCNTDVSMRMSAFLESDRYIEDMENTVNVEVSTDVNDDDIVVRDSLDVNMTYRFDSSKYAVKERMMGRHRQKVVVDKEDRAVWEQRNFQACDEEYFDETCTHEDIVGVLINPDTDSTFFSPGMCVFLPADSNDCSQYWQRAFPSHTHRPGRRFEARWF